MIKKCLICNKEIKTRYSHERIRKYCSYKCSGIAKREKPIWNKGISNTWFYNPKGVTTNSGRTWFKKGENIGESNYKWKGNKVGFVPLHQWVVRKMGKASFCLICGNSRKYFDWANISREYKRNVLDFAPLCKSCHQLYDRRKIAINLGEMWGKYYLNI